MIYRASVTATVTDLVFSFSLHKWDDLTTGASPPLVDRSTVLWGKMQLMYIGMNASVDMT